MIAHANLFIIRKNKLIWSKKIFFSAFWVDFRPILDFSGILVESEDPKVQYLPSSDLRRARAIWDTPLSTSRWTPPLSTWVEILKFQFFFRQNPQKVQNRPKIDPKCRKNIFFEQIFFLRIMNRLAWAIMMVKKKIYICSKFFWHFFFPI